MTPRHSEWAEKFHLGRVAQGALKAVRHERGEFLCAQGTEQEYMLFVMAGTARLTTSIGMGRNLLLSFYGPGEIIGDVDFFLGCPATASIQVVQPTECLALPMAQAHGLRGDVQFLEMLGIELAKKLEDSSHRSTVNILTTLKARLCAYIHTAQVDGAFREKLTDLADMLGVSYRHLQRTLQALCAEGVLEHAQKGYRVRKPAALEGYGKEYLG